VSARRDRNRLPVPPPAVKLEHAARKAGALTEFKPEQTLMKLGALKEGAKLAEKVKDWDGLQAAIGGKIEEQQAFLAWWDATVSDRGGDRQTQKGKALSSRGDNGLSVKEAIAKTGITKQQVSKWRKQLQNEDGYRESLYDRVYPAMWALRARGTTGTGSKQRFTPAEHVERARHVVGEIDLDPASSRGAQAIVKTTRYFKDDGHTKEWHGRVWLNPPHPLIAEFVEKMLAEYNAGRVRAAIMLTRNCTEAIWFQDAAAVANAICFTKGAIRFVDPDGARSPPSQGHAFFYFGGDLERFVSVFADIGFIVLPHRMVES
jgi:transposase-like protein